MKTYSLGKQEYVELIALLQLLNVCDSGGEAKHLVNEGGVLVDGETETRKRRKLRIGAKVQIQDLVIQVEK